MLKHRWIDEAAVRIRVIHNGMSPEEDKAPQAAADIRARISAGSEARLIGIVGRIDPYKGHEDLIFALARLAPEQRKHIQLVVLGSPASDDEILRLKRIAHNLGVADYLQFLGYVEGRPADLIAQLDLLVVATRSFEGFGLTLLEAMSVGVPVLATRVGAIPEFVHGRIRIMKLWWWMTGRATERRR
ncbi:MAG: glycosyltransferase family 4 protein [Betaproteobacteria bacterium]|nr:glycosyltransferase family 4 protein [Betaproteobacteria bacterium]